MINNHRLFHGLVANQTLNGISTDFVWSALSFWVFLETKSILMASLIAGSFGILSMVTAYPFGWLVDHYKKKTLLIASTFVSILAFLAGYGIFVSYPLTDFQSAESPILWLFIVVLMSGVIVGKIKAICMMPLITFLFSPEERDRKNGLIGVSNGLVFACAAALAGLAIEMLGIEGAILCAILVLGGCLVDLFWIPLHEESILHEEDSPDFDGEKTSTWQLMRQTEGLIGMLVFFLLNNLLAGVFLALLDPYGLSLTSVATWGLVQSLFGIAFIVGGVMVTYLGTGKDPIKTLVGLNAFAWMLAIFLPFKESIWFLTFTYGMYMLLFPFMEACEQTVIQKIVPLRQQGRVVGFMLGVESAVAPLTSLFIGPITQVWVTPMMGGNQTHAIALVFAVSGFCGLIVSILAWPEMPAADSK